MDFVESHPGRRRGAGAQAHGGRHAAKTPIVVEIDKENAKKDIEALDIEIPVLTPRIYREYKNLGELDVGALGHQRVAYRQFSEEEQREIVFKDITTGVVTHTTILDTAGIADYRSVIGYFAQTIMKDLRLVSGYDVLYGKVKAFVQERLFGQQVELESPNTLRNLSELAATKTIIETFKKAINALDRPGQGRCRDSGHHQAARNSALCRQGAGILDPQKEYLQQDHRRQPFRVVVRWLSGSLRRRDFLC